PPTTGRSPELPAVLLLPEDRPPTAPLAPPAAARGPPSARPGGSTPAPTPPPGPATWAARERLLPPGRLAAGRGARRTRTERRSRRPLAPGAKDDPRLRQTPRGERRLPGQEPSLARSCPGPLAPG